MASDLSAEGSLPSGEKLGDSCGEMLLWPNRLSPQGGTFMGGKLGCRRAPVPQALLLSKAVWEA